MTNIRRGAYVLSKKRESPFWRIPDNNTVGFQHMARRMRWLRTDEYADTEASLRKAAELALRVDNDPTEWKWLLIAVHSATQGMFVLSLSLGSCLQTLKSSHASALIKAYETGGKWPEKTDLDYFLKLYEKTKKKISNTYNVTPDHDDALQRLNDLRNGFIHFGPQGWSIELASLPSICRRTFEVVDALGWKSNLVIWRTQAQSKRARRSIKIALREFARLEKALSPSRRTP